LGSGQPEDAEVISTRIGSVRLSERFLKSDPPSYEELDAMEEAVSDALTLVEDRIPVHDARTLVAVDGSSTTVQAVALGLPEYAPDRVHRPTLVRAVSRRAIGLLADIEYDGRQANAEMVPGGDVG